MPCKETPHFEVIIFQCHFSSDPHRPSFAVCGRTDLRPWFIHGSEFDNSTAATGGTRKDNNLHHSSALLSSLCYVQQVTFIIFWIVRKNASGRVGDRKQLQSLIDSSTYSLSHIFIHDHSFIHSRTYKPTHSFIHGSIHLIIYSFK